MSNIDIVKEFKSNVKGNNPFFVKFISNLGQKSEEILSASYLEETYDKIVQYKQIIKNQKINIFEFDNFDDLNDELDDLIFNHENKKFVNKFLSNKYKALMTKKSFELFALLRENSVDIELIKDRFISGIAALKEKKTFNYQLEKFTNEVINFSNDKIVKLVDQNNAEVVYLDDCFLAVLVNDFKASQELGSSRWCISRSESAFMSYKKSNQSYQISRFSKLLNEFNITDNDENRYIYLYDFSKNTHNAEYLVGYTLSTKGDILHKFDANNRSYIKNNHNDLLSDIQLNYLKHLNTESKPYDLDGLLKKVTRVEDKIILCEHLNPGRLTEIYSNNNVKLDDIGVVSVYDESTFDYFLKKCKKGIFSNETITINKFFDKFVFVNDNIKLTCLNKIKYNRSDLVDYILSLDLNRYADHSGLRFILENFQLDFSKASGDFKTFLFENNSTISKKGFNNTCIQPSTIDLMNVINGIQGYYSHKDVIKTLSKIISFPNLLTVEIKKEIKKILSRDSIIDSLISDKDFMIEENMLQYMNLSKAIKVLSDDFIVDQLKFLKESRSNEGVRFYKYNRPFFEMLMANWKEANIGRYKQENAEQVISLFLNYHDQETMLDIVSWVKGKKEILLNKNIFRNNRIYGKVFTNKELFSFFNYDEKLLLPNINQLSYVSLLSKKEKEILINKIKELDIYDKSMIHNAINELFSLNGDQELYDIIIKVFEIDDRDVKEIFKEMILNGDQYSKDERLNFIETYHTELRALLRQQNENVFLKELARYL
jgi:hypothetical protein